MAPAGNTTETQEPGAVRSGLRTSVAKVRDKLATRARSLPLARHAWARYRRRLYERRIERFHAPYHRSLQELLDTARKKSGRVYHINCHSMRCVAGQQSEDGAGSVRPDFVLGDRDGTTCDPRFTQLTFQVLAAMGYHVTVNDPYKGVELIRAYSDPKAGRHSLQIEINKRLYMDEKTLAKNAGFSTLQKNLGELLRVLRNELPD